MFVGVGKPRDPAKYWMARRLRREQGLPFKRLAAEVGISVATAHAWTSDIELDPEQIQRNLFGPTGPQNPEHIARRAASWKQRNRQRRLAYQADGRATAQTGNSLHMAGCMLYWAEGSKDRNTAVLSNSDVRLVAFFRRFLTECFSLGPHRYAVRLNVYLGNGLTIEQIEDYWLDALGLPRACLGVHSINHFPTSSSGRKKNKLPYGVCTLRVRRSTRIVQHIYGAIQEYAGFDEPLWLDGPARKPRKKPAAAST